jgi:release factor glutamine methyltransferase
VATITVQAALQQARRKLPFLEVRALLCHVLEVSAAQLTAHPEQEMTHKEQQLFASLVERRIKGDPIAYLVGEREFFGHNLRVTPAVLIPRPETELLVEIALEKIPDGKDCRVLDLGTGCGNIAISLALARPSAHIIGVDISFDALQLARENAERCRAANLRLLRSDWFRELNDEKFDVIAANPPYVAQRDPHLKEGDVRFEPQQALIAGEDGLSAIRHIVQEAPAHLDAGGWLLIEHGFDQSQACAELLRKQSFQGLFSANDLAGIPRVAGGCLTRRGENS